MKRLSKLDRLAMIESMAKQKTWGVIQPHFNNCETRHVGCALKYLLRELRRAMKPRHEGHDSTTKNELLARMANDLENGSDSISELEVAWLVNELLWIRELLRRQWAVEDRPDWVNLVLCELVEGAA